MAPSLFHNLSRGKFDFGHNSYKSDTFSLGLIFLEMGNLRSIQNVYSQERGVIDQELLNDHYEKFEQRYQDSPLLCSAIRAMIEMNPKKRSDSKRLYKRLPDMEEIREYYEAVEKIEAEVEKMQHHDAVS